jgi:hypothetical protein
MCQSRTGFKEKNERLLLLTKLHIPQPKENVVHRFALFEKLHED